MKNKYIFILLLLLLLSSTIIFLISKPVTDDSLDPATCNCSGPKVSNSKLNNN